MVFVNYKNTNNASSLLISDITASATTILITDGDQVLFPSSFPFLLTLEHLDANDNVILREIVKVVSSNQNTFTIERSAGTCVQDDTATNRIQDNTAHAFSAGDKVSLYWTAEQVADIQNAMEEKGNQTAIADNYDNTLTYNVNDVVVYKGDRYKNITAITTPENFDPTKWNKVSVQYDLNDQQNQIDTLETEISQLGGAIKLDVLVLGGGGAGGKGMCVHGFGGGGGAGELKIIQGLVLRCDTYNVSVGAGGSGSVANGDGNQGGSSKFGNIVAEGGAGGGVGCTRQHQNITNGASGGGGGGGYTISGGSMGNSQGSGGWGTAYVGGGGGGIRTDGGMTCLGGIYTGYPNIGGIGVSTCFGGTLRKIGGGGAGSYCAFGCAIRPSDMSYYCGNGYWYGGGNAVNVPNSNGCPGTANTGGGGGGGGCNGCLGGAGGSGLVIVRYPADGSYGIKTATGGTITTATIDGLSYKVHTFTSGTSTFEITEKA